MIIGGGIAGCALGIFLHRAGVPDVRIFEAYPREKVIGGGVVGGGLQVAPNGMNVLNRLGLAEKLSKIGVQSHAFEFHNHEGKLLVHKTIDPFHPFPHTAVNMTRAALHEVLMEQAEKEGVPVFFGKRLASLEGLENEDGPVIAHFEDGSSAKGDFVVGADGVRSRVKASILNHIFEPKYKGSEDDEERDLEFVGLMSSGGFVQSDIFLDKPQEEQGTVHFLLGPKGRMFGYCRADGEDPKMVMWWRNLYVGNNEKENNNLWQWKGKIPTREEILAIDEQVLKDRILDVPGGWPAFAQKLVRDTSPLYRGTIHTARALRSWYHGRAVLMGDAAHAVSPHSGQGASIALEDAHYLSTVLILAYENKNKGKVTLRELGECFSTYQQGRKERAEMVVEEGKRRGEPKKRLGVAEEPPSAFQQMMMEVIVKLVFFLFLPSSFKLLYHYDISKQLEGCTTVKEVKERQQQLLQQARQAKWYNSPAFRVVFVAVIAIFIMMFVFRT